MNNPHLWRFFRAGGFDQVSLDTGADLVHLNELDQKLWVALACPAQNLEFDPRTLSLVDTDKDGRIRAPEVLAAIQWTAARLKNPDDMVRRRDPLPLSSINDATPEGQQLLASARQILKDLGSPKADAISVADVSDASKIFADTTFNGDGVIIADSAQDEPTKAVIQEIAACLGTVTDRSGKPGVDQAKTDTFFAEAAAFAQWSQRAETEGASLLPAGEGTASANAAVRAVKSKVDDFFGRCRLAAYDPRAVAILNRKEEEYLAVAAQDLSITASELAAFPLAQVAAGRALSLLSGVNPAHADALATLQAQAVKPLLGNKAELSEADWLGLQAKLAPYEAWMAAKPATSVERLGLPRLRELVAGQAPTKIRELIAQDLALQAQANSIANVERLARYVRDLHLLCVNFVNFKDLYDGGTPAIFQCGTLYLDQRSCHLCLTVEDAGRHATMAGLAGAYLAYVDCVRKSTGEKLSIAAIFSQGDDDNLMVGRNGIFYDRKGRDHDATITKIISNPISLRQAFWSPYTKLVRMIEEQISKRAAAADAASTAKLQETATKVAEADKAVPAAKPAEPRKIDVGTVAALGVAFGAIGAFLTAIVGHLTGVIAMGPLAIVGLLIGVILLISGPSLILAYVKLRKRNLGPILDANGWAINARARINVPFGTSLTGIAKLPPGSQSNLVDPFAEKQSPWPKIVVIALLAYLLYFALDRMGYLHDWTSGRIGRSVNKPVMIAPVITPADLSGGDAAK
jgi:hypothetical protein